MWTPRMRISSKGLWKPWLKTVRGADQILVLDQGSVVQKGTHDELIQQAGIYRDFVSERTESSRWTL